uniref:Uncharacterized protein n=1 Tax=Rhodnius prolixus TaxID=13249 RepID=T1HF97_RHOPR
MNAAERINDGVSTSAAGAVEIMQVDDEIASTSTTDCIGIDCVRSSIMKTHWAAASARFTTTFVNYPFEHNILAGSLLVDVLDSFIYLDINTIKSGLCKLQTISTMGIDFGWGWWGLVYLSELLMEGMGKKKHRMGLASSPAARIMCLGRR